jgi:serine/threonine protein kinase
VDDALPVVDGYEIVRELGRGGMGVVYLAKQKAINRLVALKTIRSSDDDEFAKLLLSEAHIVGKLNHPAIVPVYEANTTGDVWYFSMGLVGGSDLAHRLSRGVLSTELTAKLGVTLCDALEHAHSLGVLHLDIKPANILLENGEQPKLTDFGLSAIHRDGLNSRGIIGTPQYMSPEQAANARDEISTSSDIYSLGAVLYAMVAGRPPIISPNQDDLLLRVVSQPPTPLREFRLRIPSAFEAILLKCLQKKASQRYASMCELREDLQAFIEGKPVKARPPNLLTTLEYQLKRHVLAATVSGTATLLLLVLVGAIVYRSWTQSQEASNRKPRKSKFARRI